MSIREKAFMHNYGGRLYGPNTTSQQLWVELHFPYGLKPTVVPNLMRRTKIFSTTQQCLGEELQMNENTLQI